MGADTFPALLVLRAGTCGARQAVVDEHGAVSYADLAARSAARAAELVAAGVNKGHRVALQMPNGIDWVVHACAVLQLGAVLVPLSTLLRTPELVAQLRVAGVRHLIAAPGFRGRDYRREASAIAREELPSLAGVWWTDTPLPPAGEAERAIARALAERVVPADDMAIIFTSGSAGAPKGVIHTHGAALRANAAGLGARCVREGTRLYLPMPLFWVGGFAAGLVSALNAGATLLTEAAPEPGRTLRFIARERATLFRGWPDQAAALAAHPDFAGTDLSALVAGSLDAVLPDALRGRPGSRANLFGMTESFGPYCGYPLDEDLPEGKWGSCGRPFDGIDLRIADPDNGAVLDAGQTGNIQIGGRNILRAICGREREDVFTVDGWYDTGDRGYVDADGFLYYAGRADDMVKIKGASVYPSEVEAALAGLPGLAQVHVTRISLAGVPALGAAVVPQGSSGIDERHLDEEARRLLSAFKVPARWRVLDNADQVPRTPGGKIDRAALAALLQSGPQ